MSKKQQFVLSDGRMNTKRIMVPTEAINLDAFNANPIMYYNHVPGHVVGVWENVTNVAGKLVGEPKFDAGDPEAVKLQGKVDRGFIKAASISIRNIVAEQLSDAEGPYFKVLSCELREVSLVDIPSNIGALKLYDGNDVEVDLTTVDLNDLFNVKETKIISKEMEKKKIASILKLSDDVADDVLEGAVAAAFADSEELKALKAKIAGDAKLKAVSLCDAAIADGRMAKEAKDGFLKLADADFESFETTLKSMVKPQSLSDFAKKGATGAAPVGERTEWSFSDYQKKDPGTLAKMQVENPDGFAALYAAEFGA